MTNTSNHLITSQKSRAAALSILSNSLLIIFKLIVGITINSVSVISEAIHSGLDLAAAVIAYFSVRTSDLPPDKKHQFGHKKVENISGTVEALLIFIAAAWIMIEAYKKIINGSHVETVGLGMLVMAVSSMINFFISRTLLKTAEKTGSIALEADGLHLLTDVYTSLGVFIGLTALQITKIQILDPIIAIGVAFLIIKAAYRLTVKALGPLLDEAIPSEEEEEIISILERFKSSGQLIGFHRLRTRRAGVDRHIDMHVVVARNCSILDAHRLCDQIEENIGERLAASHVLIHVEPTRQHAKL